MHSYWLKQTTDAPLFPEIDWNKPERLDQAGRLGIVGGNKLGFAAIAEGYQVAKSTGAGEARVLLPDALRKNIPATMTDVIFAPTNNSGGLSTEAKAELFSLGDWADVMLFLGDNGKNSQTAVLYEDFIKNSSTPTVLARDAIDLVQNSFAELVEQPHLTLVASFSQIQNLFRAVYYPKVLTFSMQLGQFVEAIHKFTITYPPSIVTFHSDQLIIARGGEVVTQKWTEPMQIWRGHVAVRAACYLLWTPQAPLKAIVASVA